MKNLAILKFGGFSVSNSDKISFVSNRIKSFLSKYKKLIVVLSAPADITDDLLKISKKFSSDPRSLDMLLSSGENISISLMNMALNANNLKSIALNQYQAEIKTTPTHGNSKILSVNKKKIIGLLKIYDVIILPGFVGIDKNLNITTLGRGGSDYTAVYISKIFDSPCYLLSDIKGVYSSNPSKIEYAKKLKEISYKELFEISKVDFEIRQTKAIRYAMKQNVRLYLGSSMENAKPTLIRNYTQNFKPEIKYISLARNENDIKISMIGEKIILRKDLINKTKKYPFKKIFLNRNKITLLFQKCDEKDLIKKLYKDFILK
ncbi:MAG TPA: hypothetical protein PK103_07505 [Elusimicrobiales bacterium]|nr:hypothetical protein [Elusimicrobiales bacterium]HOL63193.1 hypothetical protein [Elusimicrobiales bacterium]HPO94826.1 hypothetical protein [Elusimicrobiales bacterium]